MKKLIISTLVIISAAFTWMAFNNPSEQNSVISIDPPQEQAAPVFPEDVQKVFETSCFGCHGDESSNTKAKMKLNFGKWSNLSDAKKVGKLENINEAVTKGDMPPKKFVEKYPDRVLGQEQKDLISNWATEESTRLMGE